jgi:DNA-binding transcriptional regulator GbsR (MarR family)
VPSSACVAQRGSFGTLLATDSGRLTAAELVERLQISPAAISGAVRYLTQLNLVVRVHEPGSRRDVYRVYDDAWYESTMRQERVYLCLQESARDGVQTLGADTPAEARMAETLAYIEFLQAEVPAMLERWREHKAKSA